MDELRELVLDIFERAFETSSLMNKGLSERPQSWRQHRPVQ
jgi:hypothetical protein